MTRLFTYILRFDDGVAPNAFGPACTLCVCKPTIRWVARVGDWVAGFGSAASSAGDYRSRLVYAMRVTEVLSMERYDARCRL